MRKEKASLSPVAGGRFPEPGKDRGDLGGLNSDQTRLSRKGTMVGADRGGKEGQNAVGLPSPSAGSQDFFHLCKGDAAVAVVELEDADLAVVLSHHQCPVWLKEERTGIRLSLPLEERLEVAAVNQADGALTAAPAGIRDPVEYNAPQLLS